MTIRIDITRCLARYKEYIHAGHLVDSGKLESALNAPFAGICNEEFFPTLIHKAARFAYGISEAQAFTDGNKRLAWICTIVFLELNGVVLQVDQTEAAHALRAVGSRECNLETSTDWLINCSTVRKEP